MALNYRPEQKHVDLENASTMPKCIPSPSHAQDSDILGLKPMVSSSHFSNWSHGYRVAYE